MPLDQSPLRFGRAAICRASRRLLVDGEPARIGSRAFDVLLVLAEHADRVVTKNELLDQVWAGRIVEENNLQVQIATLRKVLGPACIATIPGRGYKFTQQFEPAAAPAEPPAGGTLAATRPASDRPPEPARALYGRDDDVALLARLLESHRLMSVVGPGGIGKSRVAQAARAHWEAHGRGPTAELDLSSLADEALVAATVARALEIPLGLSDPSPGHVAEALRDRVLLILLDNCERLTDAVAALAVAIVRAAPQVRLLVTSQEPLKADGEQVYRLEPLAVPADADEGAAELGAVGLFVARVRAADPRFSPGPEQLAAVVDVCTQLDGIPLAIELAAARVPLLGVDGVRQMLGERLRLLSAGHKWAPPRQQTLRGALQWSWDLLAPEQRRVLARLAVFDGSFSLAAAREVAGEPGGDPWATLDDLAALVDKSLVMVEGGQPPRYRLLQSGRAFALERLQALPDALAPYRRHAEAMADLAAALDRDYLAGIPHDELVERVAPDRDNLRAAFRWATSSSGDPALAVRLAGAAQGLLQITGLAGEAQAWCRLAEPLAERIAGAGAPESLLARFELALAAVGRYAGPDRQGVLAMRSAERYRLLGDRLGRYWALKLAAREREVAGALDLAESTLDEARAVRDGGWPLPLQSRSEFATGLWHAMSGRLDEAHRHYRGQLEACQRDGDSYGELLAATRLLDLELAQGRIAEARSRGEELVARLRDSAGCRRGGYLAVFGGEACGLLGAALAEAGDAEAAAAQLREAIALMKRADGSPPWMFDAVAHTIALRGDAATAARLLGHSDALHAAARVPRSPAAQRAHDRAAAIAGTSLPAAECAALRAQGARVADPDALASVAL